MGLGFQFWEEGTHFSITRVDIQSLRSLPLVARLCSVLSENVRGL